MIQGRNSSSKGVLQMAEAAAEGQLVLNCWSGPRCVSTSLMYSWAQRGDTEASGAGSADLLQLVVAVQLQDTCCHSLRTPQVLDEPLYASYLKLTGAERPYTDLASVSLLALPPSSRQQLHFLPP